MQNTSTATTVYPTFSTSSANGNSQAVINTGISANLSNNSITATTFVGSLSGAATSATTAGTVTTADQPNITSVGTLTSLNVNAAANAVTFRSNVATGTAPLTVTSTTRVANLNVATAGTADSATAATNAAALLQNTSTATTVYPTFTTSSANGNSSAVISTGISANLSNNSITATTFVGSLSGAATSATSATNAAAVSTSAATTTTVYPTFVTATTTANYALNVVSGISANLSNNSITATTFVGSLSGTATSATTAGTVTTNAQPNITSVSTSFTGLTLAANGNITLSGASSQITGANLVSAGFFSGNGSSITAINANSITSGTLAQARLANSSLTVNGTAISLGGSGTITANTTQTLSNGTYITGDSFNGGTARTWAVDATTTNTANKVVARDANGSFSANIITATLSGAATSATSATNAAAVLSNVRTTGTYYPTFISATANGNYALNSSTAFSANLTTGTVFATDFNGNLIVSNINYGTTVGLTGLTTNHFGNSAATSGNITFQRFRGNNTAFFELLNGDQIGLINFVAWDGYNINPAASITSIVDAAYTPSAFTSAPGAIVFNTANATQGGVPTEKMRVASTGNVGIANTNPAHTLSITGTLNASGSANVGSLGTTGLIVATGNVTGGNVIATGYHIRSVGTGISANGTTQAQATAITKEMNIVSTVLSTQGVVLPTAVAGMVITITNTSANALLVYPAVNGIINTQSANAAYSQPAGATLQFIAPTTTQWYTVGATFA